MMKEYRKHSSHLGAWVPIPENTAQRLADDGKVVQMREVGEWENVPSSMEIASVAQHDQPPTAGEPRKVR